MAPDEHDAAHRCDDDGDSLFGDGDEDVAALLLDQCASLFGGGDDGDETPSLFMDDALPSSPSMPLSSVSSLVLPSWPSSQPCQSPSPSATSPCLPLLPTPASSLSPELQLTFPTLPCEGAHAPGQTDVSTQAVQSVGEALDFDNMDLAMMLELELGQDDHTIDTPPSEPSPARDAQECPVDFTIWSGTPEATPDVAVEQPPDQAVELPRRIDGPGDDLAVLLPHIKLSAGLKPDDLYALLGLNGRSRKALERDLESYLSNPEYNGRVDAIIDLVDKDFKKLSLLRISLKYLRSDDRGTNWFGGSDQDGTERLRWPADSSMLLCHFVVFLYRCIRNWRQRIYSASKRKQKKREEQVALQDPATKHYGSRHYKSPQTFVVSGLAGDTAARTAQLPPSNFFTAPLVPKDFQRAMVSLPRGSGTSEIEQPTKKLKRSHIATDPFVKVPPDAELKYVIHIIRRSSGRSIPQIELSHSDGIKEIGFWPVINRCRSMGFRGAVEVLTPLGFQMVQNDEEWDEAVRDVYREEMMDGVVKVRVQSYA